MSETPEARTLPCGDQCGATVPEELDALQAGWSYMDTLRRWRCTTCAGELATAGQITGTSLAASVDTLPPNSIGALKKPTADTIVPPSVKP